MKKAFLLGLALSTLLGSVPAVFAEDVNPDAPYGDREPGGYQHLTTHYHNYWRAHHHPWSNIERERFVVRDAQNFKKQTQIYEGQERKSFVKASDTDVRDAFTKFVWNAQHDDFSATIPAYFVEQIKSRPMVDEPTREALQLNEFLPGPLSYNDITYLPDDFTRKQLGMPDQRFKSGLIGNDLVLYDVVTGRVRGLWKDILN